MHNDGASKPAHVGGPPVEGLYDHPKSPARTSTPLYISMTATLLVPRTCIYKLHALLHVYVHVHLYMYIRLVLCYLVAICIHVHVYICMCMYTPDIFKACTCMLCHRFSREKAAELQSNADSHSLESRNTRHYCYPYSW